MTTSFSLTSARLNKGLSQRELAEECQVGLATVQRLEDGMRAHPRNAKKIADYFGIQVTDLLPVEKEAAA